MKPSRHRSNAVHAQDSPLLQSARRLWAREEYDEALRMFDEAVRQEPLNIRALVDCARAHGFRHRYERVDQLVEQLLRLEPRRPEVYHLAGETYRMLAQGEKAVECFEKACRQSRVAAESLLELATLYEREHRLEAAAELIDRALGTQPKNPAALLLKARIRRRERNFSQAETLLRDLIALHPDNPRTVAETWGELSLLYDERGDFDAAWSAILECKRVMLAREAAERAASDHVLARFRAMVDSISPEFFARLAARKVDSPRRLALLTGFPRSGTTLLERVLDAHPMLISSEERDVFSREVFPALGRETPLDTPVQEMLERAAEERLARAREHYLRQMEAQLGQPIGQRVHLDKNPAMNLMIPAMLRVFPELRIIVALRDPRDVVLSCFLRYLPLNPVSVNFLTLQRAAERYALDMRAWLAFRHLLQTPWIEVRYEDVVSDLAGQARRVLELLELPWDEAVLDYRGRSDRRVFSPTYEAVTKPLYTTSIGRWRAYAKHLEPALEVLSPFARAFGYDA